MHNQMMFGFVLTGVFLSATITFAEDVPVPQGAGRKELIENELQKASEWAERERVEQTQENYLEKQANLEQQIDDAKGKMESDEGLKAVVDERWQERAIEPTQEVSQEIRQEFAQEEEQELEKDKDAYAFTETEKETSADDDIFDSKLANPHSFELATEVYRYKYTEVIGVKDEGIKGGLVGAYQYRISENQPISSLGDFFKVGNQLNFFRLEGRVSYGKVEYEGSGTWDGIPDWNLEARGLLGMEVPFTNAVTIKPYGGLAYRYLYNDFSKYPSSLVGGQQYYSGYDRESNYVYVPIGAEISKRLGKRWTVAVTGEFDWFVWGKQISHLEDMVDENDVNAGYDKLENTQKEGLGWRASFRLSRQGERFDFFVEPFVRFWHIDDSEVELITAGGAAICQGNLCSAGMEPDNKTWEYGLNLGAKF